MTCSGLFMPAGSCPPFRAPAPSSAGYNGEAFFGLGLGPSDSHSEQIVARAFCTGAVPTYVAYFEVGGVQAARAAGGALTPRPGDRISATVSYLGVFRYVAGPYTYHVSRYRFSIADLTHPKHATIIDSSDCLAQRCDHTTAEVTAGIPFARHPALADYGKVVFSGIRITDTRRHRGSLAKNKHWKVVRLVESDPTTHSRAASPSALTHHGTQFSDRWLAY